MTNGALSEKEKKKTLSSLPQLLNWNHWVYLYLFQTKYCWLISGLNIPLAKWQGSSCNPGGPMVPP